MPKIATPDADFASTMINTAANVSMAVVVSSMPRLVITQDDNAPGGFYSVAGDHDLTVYADEVVVRGPVNMPSRNVKIFARTIGGEWGAGGAPAINVDGAAGSMSPPSFSGSANPGSDGDHGQDHNSGGTGHTGINGQNGSAGGRGQKGGTISLVFGAFAPAFSLQLSAKGGAGGNGTDGQGGGRGGRGGDGDEWQVVIPGGRIAVRQVHGARGGDGGRGSNGGNAGGPGVGGDGGSISVDTLAALPAGLTSSIDAGATGAAGHVGKGGAGGGGGSGGGHSSFHQPDGSTGGMGADGTVPAAAGTAAHGHMAIKQFATQDVLAPLAIELLPQTASCGQQWTVWCAMMLRVAKAAYLAADPTENVQGFKDALNRLVWLQQLLSPFIPPPSSYSYLGQNDIAQLHAMSCEVAALIARLNHRHDVFGHEYNFVPLVSVDVYIRDLTVLNDAYRDVESQYKAYLVALDQQETAKQQLANALTSTGTTLSNISNQMSDILATLSTMPSILDKQRQAVLDQQHVLQDDIKDLKEAIEHKANCPLASIFQALQMCAFMPEDASVGTVSAIAGSMAGETAVSSMENVPLGAGGTMSRDYLINQVGVYGTGVTSIQQGYGASGAFITSDDPNGYKLAMSAQQLQAELTPYTSLTEARQTLADLKAYVDLVGVMNASILRYNTLVSHYIQMQSQTAQLKGQMTGLQNELQAAIDPSLPRYTQYFSGLHGALRDICIYQIYMVSRAYEFWAIKPYAGLYGVLGRGNPGTIAQGTVATAIGLVVGALSDAKESFGRDSEPFPSPPAPGVLSRSGGIPVRVTDATALARLRQKGEMYFTVPPAMIGSTKTKNPFAGKSNVRLFKARPWVTGATTASRTLVVTLTHTGTETLVSPDGKAMAFKHDPVVVSFTYDYSLHRDDPNAIAQDADIGSRDKSDYALVGPFTTWRLVIDPNLNDPSLKLDGITEVEIEFWGEDLPFHSAS